nr:MAG TPA: hypothetical protein [Caudoviricetes sp.]
MMKNVSTTVNKPLDLCDSLYDLRGYFVKENGGNYDEKCFNYC